jgi:hypothetical protein
MIWRRVERALWSCAAIALAAGLLGLRAAERTGVAAGAMVLPVVDVAVERPTSGSFEAAVGAIAAHNLFRAERASAEEGESSASSGPTGMTVPSNKPHLVLKGVLGGPPWDAIVEGIPGREGAVVIRVGESVAGVTVRAVRHDTAYVRGFDTTWALPLARTW